MVLVEMWFYEGYGQSVVPGRVASIPRPYRAEIVTGTRRQVLPDTERVPDGKYIRKENARLRVPNPS